MSKKEESRKNKTEGEGKGRFSKKDSCEEKKESGRWSDVFNNVTYSSGPGDNVYVFG